MKRFDVQLDITPLRWSSDLERKVKGWADRKPFGVAWHYNQPIIYAQYLAASQAQMDKATKTICTIIRREKKFAAAQLKLLTPVACCVESNL
jgi:hypothetical protein